MRAIDLYAGIGGWSLGLRLADIDVVASYEWWKPAIDTHNGNHGGKLQPVDIRKLELANLPSSIDLVVGSPPCTEFSYANRGGSGDIAEGLKDLVRYFEIVEHLKPRFWAMENVPRVAEVLRHGFKSPGHALYRFRHLGGRIEVIDFSDYGAPQARRRCIATNIPLEQVEAYRASIIGRTLGDVVTAFGTDGIVIDPIWGVSLPSSQVTETQAEPPLNVEELRMNRESKEFHPVYNNMEFPDSLDQRSRTVTATCTRVSRESIVIANPDEKGQFRRLTIRERASLQGFPITYQFYAKSFSEKAKMVGNAIPPTFTYLIALAAKGVTGSQFKGFKPAAANLKIPLESAPITLPDREGNTYPTSRGFRAALPGLRFKSGMRFELSNSVVGVETEWRVRFFYGASKDVREIDLDGAVTQDLRGSPIFDTLLDTFQGEFARARRRLSATNPQSLQLAWAHKIEGLVPYEVVDLLGELGLDLSRRLEMSLPDKGGAMVVDYVLAVASGSGEGGKLANRSKLEKYALRILSGLIVGEWFNTLNWHQEQKAAA